MANKIYNVKVQYTFICDRQIKADSQEQANEYAATCCWCKMPSYHSSLPEDDVSWLADVGPESENILSS